MRVFTAFLLAVLLACTAAIAQVGLPWPGPGTPHSTGGGSFTGPGDITTFVSWWGSSFAFSAAKRGASNFMVNLCNPAGSNCVDVGSDATTGIVTNAPTVNGAPCDNASHICTVAKMYDQAGTVLMSKASAQDPTWVVSGYTTGVPCIRWGATASTELDTGTGGTTTAQPFIIEGVFKRDSGQSANQNIAFSDGGGNVLFFHEHSASVFDLYAGGGSSEVQVALTDNTWGAAAGVYNNTTSYLRVNSTTASATLASTLGLGTTQCIGTQGCSSAGTYVGMICEVGIVASSSTTVADNLVANARASYRYNF